MIRYGAIKQFAGTPDHAPAYQAIVLRANSDHRMWGGTVLDVGQVVADYDLSQISNTSTVIGLPVDAIVTILRNQEKGIFQHYKAHVGTRFSLDIRHVEVPL